MKNIRFTTNIGHRPSSPTRHERARNQRTKTACESHLIAENMHYPRDQNALRNTHTPFKQNNKQSGEQTEYK